MFKPRILLACALALLFSFSVGGAALAQGTASTPISDGGITPYIIAGANPGGNRTCAEVGIAFFGDPNYYKFNSGQIDYNGSFSAPFPSWLEVTTDGTYVSWESDFDIGAVIIKGGNHADVYVYDPETTSDSGLASPPAGSGNPAGLSNITFCYNLNLKVTKTADTTFTRTYEWDIWKSADQTDLLLAQEQQFGVNYEVKVDVVDWQDGNWAVNGTIEVFNPAPIPVLITSVTDEISGIDEEVHVSCVGGLPQVVLSQGTLVCTYSSPLPDADSRVNTATATSGTPEVGNGTGTADIDFGADPTDLVDECIDVNDTNVGFLGTVCAGDPLPKTFTYALSFGKHADADVPLECGDNIHTNIASFKTNDTGATGQDDWTVNAEVVCEQGCTLTQGYWKTHSSYGPAPYDDTWAQIGEDTIFFKSGKSYYQVLWTPPAGNAYYILAHQYIAAELNRLNGADFTAAQAAFDEATGLFEQYTPTSVAGLKGNDPVRKKFTSLAETLDKYNNGLIGPGHCSEDRSSDARSLDVETANTLFLPLVRR